MLGAPPVDGLGNAGGFKLIVEDPTATRARRRSKRPADELVDARRATSRNSRDVFTGFRADTPWLYLNIDRDAAQTMGVSVGDIINALQVYFGSLYVNDFNLFGRTWQVNVQADEQFRERAADLKQIRVKNARRARWCRSAAFISVRDTTGPVMIQRYNLYPALAVNATPAPGVEFGRGDRGDGAGRDATCRRRCAPSGPNWRCCNSRRRTPRCGRSS